MCLQFLQLLKSPSSLLAHALPTLVSVISVNSVNSETIGSVIRISDIYIYIYEYTFFIHLSVK